MSETAIPDLIRLREFRRDLHAHPELAFDERRTADRIAARLAELGIPVEAGVGRTGVVGVIDGSRPGAVVGLRADMDALPIVEGVDRPYRSTVDGVMHACGHDGHVAMLLGAAEILSADRDFAGRVVLVFQPAEEGGAGAPAMIDDGLFERFGIEEMYALHNIPGIEAGHFAIRPGTMLASFDDLTVTISADGAHAMAPHATGDVIAAGSYLVAQLQTVVSRRLDPLVPAVVSITSFHAGTTNNVLPPEAVLTGTARCLSPETRERIESAVHDICAATATAHGVDVRLEYVQRYPVTVNDPVCAARAVDAAVATAGGSHVDANTHGILAAEDFSFFLHHVPGAYAFIGNGPITEESGPVHNAAYDFNDDILEPGARYLATVALAALSARSSD